MDIQPVDLRDTRGLQAAGRDPGKTEDLRLRDACQQFEGLLLGILLKESLRENLSESAGDTASGFEQFRDFCTEQVASTMAESSSMGIGDQLYEQLRQEGVAP
jgi:peptidoglycan hydrolase FlgJ